jgi:hypothetical protein
LISDQEQLLRLTTSHGDHLPGGTGTVPRLWNIFIYYPVGCGGTASALSTQPPIDRKRSGAPREKDSKMLDLCFLDLEIVVFSMCSKYLDLAAGRRFKK